MELPGDVTLFTGGLFPRLLRRFGISPLHARNLSVVVLPAIAWVPLLALAAIEGTLLPGKVKAPFLFDCAVHVRFLAVLPLLVVAGIAAENRLRPTLEAFVVRRLVPPDMLERFQGAVAQALRLGDSSIADLIALIVIFAIVIPFEWRAYAASGLSTWYAAAPNGVPAPSLAGYWFAFVSLPLFQFLFIRWYYRLFVWGNFLWKVSRMRLQLVPSHPDRLGGLGFLLIGTKALATFAFAHGALLAGWIANLIFFGGMKVTDFKQEAAIIVGIVLLITVGPLLVFMPALVMAKRRGIIQYGALAALYVYDFDKKWLHGKPGDGAGEETLVGSADIQSLADMGGSYDPVEKMRSVPFTMDLIATFVIATFLPVAPLLLTVMPLKDLLKKVTGILF